ncbi:hypothetical protein EBB07_13030 [Paenibacillaceae bacterium]|nr:hypothetical protein EBB07_13030 [Paenibacillaceae bacterium]
MKKQKWALNKLHESYRSRQIQKLEDEFKDLRKVIVDEENYPTVDQIYEHLGQFRELWSAAVTSEEKNRELKKLP